MNVRLKQSYCIFITLLLLIAEFSSGKMGIDDDFIVLDGILVRKSDEINTRSEQQKKKEQANVKYTLEKEEARLYNESKEITKHLPSECQVCRLMVTEIQRKLRIFGKVKAITEEGHPVYYRDDMVIWHVFDELCDEMKMYNIDKKTPFRYRRGVESYLRRQVNEMTAHAPKTQWVWNLEEADIDDPTGEIRRLGKQCYEMLVKYQNDIRRWFYSSQTSNPLKWICANKILTRQNPQGCLWIKDKYMDELVKYDQGASEEANEATHEEKHSEL